MKSNNYIKMIRGKIQQKEIQINLDGQEVQHNNNHKQVYEYIYSSIYFKYNIYWEKKGRVVETLKYFYLSRLLSKVMISKKYKSSISDNSISKHIKKLLKEELIKLIASGVGTNRSEKYYELTSKGEKVYEEILKELSL